MWSPQAKLVTSIKSYHKDFTCSLYLMFINLIGEWGQKMNFYALAVLFMG